MNGCSEALLILLSLPFDSDELVLSGLRPSLVFHGEITVVEWPPTEELHIPITDWAVLDTVALPSSDTFVTVRFCGVQTNCFSGDGWRRSGSSSEVENESYTLNFKGQ